jgi:hypothetical protein
MKLFRIVLCGILLAISGAAAQTSPGDLVVDVPFAFVVAGQSLPAGHYIVKAVSEGQVRIINSQSVGVYVPTHGDLRNTSDDSKLVFHRYGDTYFLAGAWVKGNTTGRALFPSRAEREMAKAKTEMELAVVRPAH